MPRQKPPAIRTFVARGQRQRLFLWFGLQAVDYWSLGVTVFKLLTGSRPFNRRQFQAFVDDTRCRMGLDYSKYNVRLKYDTAVTFRRRFNSYMYSLGFMKPLCCGQPETLAQGLLPVPPR